MNLNFFEVKIGIYHIQNFYNIVSKTINMAENIYHLESKRVENSVFSQEIGEESGIFTKNGEVEILVFSQIVRFRWRKWSKIDGTVPYVTNILSQNKVNEPVTMIRLNSGIFRIFELSE